MAKSKISYHWFNHLSKLVHQDFTAKIGQGILSRDLMDREYTCSLPYKVNVKYVWKGKCRGNYSIFGINLSLCDAIYIGNTQQTFKKIMDSHLSNVQLPLKSVQKSDSFAAHSEQHFKSTA